MMTSSESASITSLVLTGTIDARDFKFIRDNIPNLSELDLSTITIQSYNGSNGTIDASTSYPANGLPQNAFRNSDCSANVTLKAVALPASITSIGMKAFEGCTGLTNLILPKSVNSIGNYAFFGCTGLTSLSIPDAVTTIGTYAFTSCTNLTVITLPGSLTSIGDWAFGNCNALIRINMPKSIKTIGNYAFYGCSGLSSLELPATASSIGESAFACCTGITSFTMPDSVNTIQNNVFANCYQLKNVTLSKAITSIGNWAFLGCTSLSGVTIPETVTSIGNGAFYDCTALSSLTIPNAVTTIGENALFNCANLSNLTIGTSVSTINNYAFGDCTNLSTINMLLTTPITVVSTIFFSVDKSVCTLNVPKTSITAYQAASVWKEFYNIAAVPAELGSQTDQSAICVYPNPFTDGFFIKGFEGTGWLTLSDLSGKLLVRQPIIAGAFVSVNWLPKGVYLAKLTMANGNFESKLLKE
ncbi:MAG: leucine-rich repeat protein [Bacteroidota bacterium]|nr:leucine-rich repeat protein [Bacteroidota bacterium]